MAQLGLSEAQQRVLELHLTGMSPQGIANTMQTTEGVVQAQFTRIRNKGYTIVAPGAASSDDVDEEEDEDDEDDDFFDDDEDDDDEDDTEDSSFGSGLEVLPSADRFMATPVEPPRDRRTEFEVIDEVATSGQAVYNVEQAVDKLRSTFGAQASANDAHPMVLLGVTIQFMKLAGGRLAAHQLIEDVYSALRGLAGTDAPPMPQETTQKSPELKDVLELLHRQLQKMG